MSVAHPASASCSSVAIKPKGAVVNSFAPGGATVEPGSAVDSVGSASPDLPNASVEDSGSTIPKSTEASMYSSRQIHVFQPTAKVMVKPTSVTIDNIEYYPIPHLKHWINDLPCVPNKFARTRFPSLAKGGGGGVSADDDDAPGYNQMIHDDEYVLMDIVRRAGLSKKARAFIRSGPRKNIVWKAGEVKAAIVTCGGLCPGLNDVISELFTTLYYNYGVDHIYGIRSGFRGFWHPAYHPWIELTPEKVKGVYELGGTVLGSSRGGFDLNKIVGACIEKGVNQVYIIGGDGTHRAAQAIGEECKKRGLKICVVGIPKTIDNDLGVIDRSFGFSTAVTEARKAISTAIVEATAAPNGIGLVQLMGRHAGYIAAHAVLAARQVDLCLIPEVKFPLDGPHGVLQLTETVLKRQGYAVIVVAEGAGMDLCEKSVSYDESGNKKLPEPGKFLQNEINKYFKSKKVDVSVKYIDPSYMIRAVPADAADAVYIQSISQNAVHGAMAGLTGFTSGLVNNRTVLLPFELIRATSPSYLNPDGRTWERVVSLTHQPRWSQTSKEEKAAKVIAKL